jgi:predicted ATPase/DNA-binding winged helix-turn-helix (wHTH) protein
MDDSNPPIKDEIISFGPFRLSVAERLLEQEGRPVKLGARAFDILVALIARAGEIVDKKELIAQVWPDITVDEGSLRFHVAALRKVLGDGQGGARYLSTLPGQGYSFAAAVSRSGATQAASTPSAVVMASEKLPARLTRMVGRLDAIEKISELLLADRFVTVAGPGGIGKTTVAVALAHGLAQQFEGAVYFFDLGPIGDPLLVPGAIASALGIMVRSDDPTPGLIAFLRDRRMLLVLDSCEHVIGSVAELAERIFQEAQQVYILATSRELLRVEGERIHQLSPLESPPDDPNLTASKVLAFPAAQLFVERVAASGRSLELSDSDAATVGEICRRLDGIALAIELAAGRVNAYGIQETATLLDHRFRLLWSGRRTALLRHQTLGATLDWSYHLLTARERVVLRRLSIFVGTFTLDAARAVASWNGVDESEVVTDLASLVSKSLIAVDTSGTRTRYRLLDTARAYVYEKLIECGEVDPMAQRHAGYYLRLLEQGSAVVATASKGRTSHAAADHLGNARAALEWSFSERGDLATGVALAAATAGLFLELSLLTECQRWTEQAIATLGQSELDQSDAASRREIELQAAFGLSQMFTRGNTGQVRQAFRRGLEVAERLGDLHNQLQLLGRLHIFHERIGDFRSSMEFALRGEAVADKLGDPVGIAEAHSALGISYHLEGNNPTAHSHLEAALMQLPVSKRINTFHFGFDYRNRARIALARTLWIEGFPDQAVTVARQTVERAETFNHPITLCIALIWAVSVSLWNGDVEDAEEYIDRFIRQADRHSLAPYQAVGRGVKGELAVKRGEAETGIRLLRSSLESLHGLRYELLTTQFNATLAEGLADTGQFQTALVVIDNNIAAVDRNGDLFYMPELLRIKGAILTASGITGADECFRQSLDMAERQSALSWQLRTAISLARSSIGSDHRDTAAARLKSIRRRLTEGFETIAWKLSGQLLTELGHPAAND